VLGRAWLSSSWVDLSRSVLPFLHNIGACGGELACSTCHLVFDKEVYDTLPPKTDEEEDMLDLAFELTETWDYTTTITAHAQILFLNNAIQPNIFIWMYAMRLALVLVVKFEWRKSSKESKCEYPTMAIDEKEDTILLSWWIDTFVLFSQYWTVSHENPNVTSSWLDGRHNQQRCQTIHIHGSWINQYYNQ
jgi:hypothetical protein